MAQNYNRFVTEENWKKVNKYNKELYKLKKKHFRNLVLYFKEKGNKTA